ncbi:hypothetical protein LAJ19_03045 [Deinococcus taeanensis]|uniref:hypothetical protein n=1 Tax=Deinococcus taeanensis TaxID=2737050 RepID=UPI001CDC7E44|nr:hypothetical protein [Deinococcus taeanensis]UBV43210.1 hypothetical protein LAJ19_03045 [Deinococcus taeanensis]
MMKAESWKYVISAVLITVVPNVFLSIPGKDLPGGGVWAPLLALLGVPVYWWLIWKLAQLPDRSRSTLLLGTMPVLGPLLLGLTWVDDSSKSTMRALGTALVALPLPLRILGISAFPEANGEASLFTSLFLVAAILFGLNGGVLYARSKHQSPLTGLLGVFSLVGLIALFLLPDKSLPTQRVPAKPT